MPGKNPYNQYKETQIMTASQGKLIVLLYEGAIKFIEGAISALDERKLDTTNNYLLRAQDIVTELALSINFEGGELATKLYNLYMYFNKELLEANIRKDRAQMVRMKEMLASLLDSWRAIADKPNATPVKSGGVNIAG